MSFYKNKLKEVRNQVFNNEDQIGSVIAIRNFILSHYADNLNLDAISEAHAISKYHLIRLFKKYYGQTPRQFLIDTRIENSKILLKQGVSVTETCFAVGFDSLGSFSSLFKTRTGKPPGKFRNEQFSRSKSD